MNCDLCGAQGFLLDTIVEGTMMAVCKKCSTFGVVVNQPASPPVKTSIMMQKEEDILNIVPNYPHVIKSAREKKDLTHKQLASALAEKESVIQKVEAGKMEPPLSLAKKLEQFLKIKLITEERIVEKKKLDLRDSSLTIGDLLALKKKS